LAVRTCPFLVPAEAEIAFLVAAAVAIACGVRVDWTRSVGRRGEAQVDPSHPIPKGRGYGTPRDPRGGETLRATEERGKKRKGKVGNRGRMGTDGVEDAFLHGREARSLVRMGRVCDRASPIFPRLEGIPSSCSRSPSSPSIPWSRPSSTLRKRDKGSGVNDRPHPPTWVPTPVPDPSRPDSHQSEPRVENPHHQPSIREANELSPFHTNEWNGWERRPNGSPTHMGRWTRCRMGKEAYIKDQKQPTKAHE